MLKVSFSTQVRFLQSHCDIFIFVEEFSKTKHVNFEFGFFCFCFSYSEEVTNKFSISFLCFSERLPYNVITGQYKK